MNRFGNILYFADGVQDDLTAYGRAVELARTNSARLTVFDVIPDRQGPADYPSRLGEDIQTLLREDREAQLDAMIKRNEDPGAPVVSRVVSGISFVEVIRAVLQEGFDLVMKDARPPDSFVKRTLGSTDLHLLRKCPCPIWIDRPDSARPYRNVLAAVDPARSGYEGSARLIMDLATSLAEREGARLSVVHAWHLSGEEQLRSGRVDISNEDLDLLLTETESAHRKDLAALLTDYGMTPDADGVYLMKGNAATSIRDLSRELDADLVVMGTLGRPDTPGVFIGNTAEDVLQTTQASVLAIKPFGFLSPVAG
jgi:nucleotide-binding universal stress UspA family protein